MQFLWIVFSSALDDIKERVSLAAHDVIVVDGSSNANGSEGETSLCTIIAASLFGQILLMSLLMSQCVTCKADTTLPAALTRFFTNPWQQLPLFASMSNYLYAYKPINAFRACALSSSNSWYGPCLLESSFWLWPFLFRRQRSSIPVSQLMLCKNS